MPRSRSGGASSSPSRRPRRSRTTRPPAAAARVRDRRRRPHRRRVRRGRSPSSSRRGLARDFRRIDPAHGQGAHRRGGTAPPAGLPRTISRRGGRSSSPSLGVIIHTGQRVTELDANGVTLSNGDRLDAATVIWAAGVRTVALAEMLPGRPRSRRSGHRAARPLHSGARRGRSSSATWPVSNRTASRCPA